MIKVTDLKRVIHFCNHAFKPVQFAPSRCNYQFGLSKLDQLFDKFNLLRIETK